MAVNALSLLKILSRNEMFNFQDGCQEGCHNLQVSYIDFSFYTSITILCLLLGNLYQQAK